MGDAVPRRRSPGNDHRLSGTPRPPAGGAAPMGDAIPHTRSPSSDHSFGGRPVPPAGGTAPMGDAEPHGGSPGNDHHLDGTPRPPSRWGRTNGGCRPPQALSRQRPPPRWDTLSPQPVGPHKWGILSHTGALQAATTACVGHPAPSRWVRAYWGYRPRKTLSTQQPPPGRDAPSPQPVGPRLWGMPSPTHAL